MEDSYICLHIHANSLCLLLNGQFAPHFFLYIFVNLHKNWERSVALSQGNQSEVCLRKNEIMNPVFNNLSVYSLAKFPIRYNIHSWGWGIQVAIRSLCLFFLLLLNNCYRCDCLDGWLLSLLTLIRTLLYKTVIKTPFWLSET